METELGRYRQTEFPVEPLFRDRWSPRAMSGEALQRNELMSLFEAARWAPSSYNSQPWRFIYALRDSSGWERLYRLLVEFNQSWASRAGALIVILGKITLENGTPSRSYALDTGAAWENFSLQGWHMGLVVHGMGGFDHLQAREQLGVPQEYEVLAMAAVGRPGPVEVLPERLRKREIPSTRRPLRELVFEHRFPTEN